MLILLPPSETKTAPGAGSPVDPATLSFPGLTAAREQVLTELAATSAREDALEVLGVGERLRGEIERNTRLGAEPASPALSVYTGVLYDALDPVGMTTAQRAAAAESLVVVSALWGAVRPEDRIPAYRLSMGAELPGLGRLAAHWRRHLPGVLEPAAGDGLVVDCRSAAYAAAWRGPRERTVGVKVVRERQGKRQVVSHMAKHTRGLLARHLLERAAEGERPRTPQELLAAARERWTAELTEPTARSAGELVVVRTED
ncbi:YaaA family protein [uncultured Kocuria sp.]|uniref:YaaA family protein n=1 Tax=uncultured Kocuria sp. TaxID=259305 RepID=UPI002635B6B8|nr:peroxide stress protein YaaA [uncultured Kocuria sp.]